MCSNYSIRLIGIDPFEDVATADEEVEVIGDTRNLVIEVKQVYKDKNILVEVMRQYAVGHKFHSA